MYNVNVITWLVHIIDTRQKPISRHQWKPNVFTKWTL